MDPKIWGRPLWESLIYIAKGYPENPKPVQRGQYSLFFRSLGFTLPCYSCRENYASHLKAEPIQLDSRDDLIHWLHRIHNLTLTQMNRKTTSFDEFINKYTSPIHELGRCFFMILILVAIAVGCYYFFYKKHNRPFFLVR